MNNSEGSGIEKKENIVELEVIYGLERDILRVKNTLQRLPWYIGQGYDPAFIKLPEGISESSTQEEITIAVRSEYNEEEYKAFEAFIKEQWGNLSQKFEELKNIPSLDVRENYTAVLTKYGMGASYNVEKGEAIININNREKEKLIGTILHEIVHMAIQHLVEKYQIKHWHKERLVDLMMEKYFPQMTKMQNIKEGVTAVDEAFNTFFPDFEAIVRAVH